MHPFTLAGRSMVSLRVGTCLLAAIMLPAASQAACTAIVLPEVEVGQAGFFLSDLLDRGSCPQLAAAAARVRLGAAPLAGSVRVLEGREVRALLESLPGVSHAEGAAIEVPGRIRVRRAGQRASCAEIQEMMFSKSASPMPDATVSESRCGAGGSILRGTPVEITARRWDAGLASWELRVRCRQPEDCVPFLIRVRSPELPAEIRFSRAQNTDPDKAIETRAGAQMLVHRGQTAALVWDEQGVRVIVPSVSLDGGNAGDTVRARIAGSGRVVRAIVTGAGQLRVAS